VPTHKHNPRSSENVTQTIRQRWLFDLALLDAAKRRINPDHARRSAGVVERSLILNQKVIGGLRLSSHWVYDLCTSTAVVDFESLSFVAQMC
jgi:hypothetical protein